MQCFEPEKKSFGKLTSGLSVLCGAALVLWTTGCGSSASSTPPPAQQYTPQTYMAPGVAYTLSGSPAQVALETYTIDDSAGKFSETLYLQEGDQQGPQILNYGSFKPASDGFLDLGILASYGAGTSGYSVTTYPADSPLTGSWAIELPDQAGGLVQMVGRPVKPLVAATSCPNLASPQTWQFLTIPAAEVAHPSNQPAPDTWNPVTDTAYGSVDISTTGSTVTLDNIQQFTLPSVGGSGLPAIPVGSPVMASCGPTFYGNTISFPSPLVITDPGTGSEQLQASAVMGIGPTGLLVEDNGNGKVSPGSTGINYQNDLGAGTGAVGLPKPASALDTGSLVGAQYQGFVYGAGVYTGPGSSGSGWSSHVVSFGSSGAPSSCASLTPSTSTPLIYGGDFPDDDPTASSGANSDLAIDLGAQDTSNNGLYRAATVCIGANYAANTTGQTDIFPAVAIAGQLNGKNAIFVLGIDSSQPWEIYLLPSN